jgi:hypothetical protein
VKEITQRVLVLNLAVEVVLEQLQEANTGDLKSRELSLAITNIEQGSHWLSSLMQRLEDEPED